MTTPNPWRYELDADGVEFGRWQGDSAPALASHFHAQAQCTFVLSGSRRFAVGDRTVLVSAGECLLIPAQLPHRSLPHVHAGTACLNVYLDVVGPVPSVPLAGTLETVSRLAQQAGVSREAFTRGFARRTGLPPGAYRIIDRLNRGRMLLRRGASVADVACELGFADQSHFGRLFKRRFGTTPGAYSRGVSGLRASQTF
jgi:AraC-like DNA-binding protein